MAQSTAIAAVGSLVDRFGALCTPRRGGAQPSEERCGVSSRSRYRRDRAPSAVCRRHVAAVGERRRSRRSRLQCRGHSNSSSHPGVTAEPKSDACWRTSACQRATTRLCLIRSLTSLRVANIKWAAKGARGSKRSRVNHSLVKMACTTSSASFSTPGMRTQNPPAARRETETQSRMPPHCRRGCAQQGRSRGPGLGSQEPTRSALGQLSCNGRIWAAIAATDHSHTSRLTRSDAAFREKKWPSSPTDNSSFVCRIRTPAH